MTTQTQPEVIHYPQLYKATSKDGIQEWDIRVEPCDDGTAEIVTTFGLRGGKKQEQRERIAKGKNAGKKNETSPYEQASREAQSKWEKQRDRKHYAEDPTGQESAAKRQEAPMLAYEYEKYAKKVEWDSAFGQPKLNGHRILARKQNGQVTLWSRKGEQITALPHIVEILQKVMPDGATFDGEGYRHGFTLNKIGSLIRRKQPESELVQFHCYDVVLDAPYAARREMIQTHLEAGIDDIVLPVQTEIVKDLEEITRLEREWLELGFEGAILRHSMAPYQAGKRTKYLLKVKTFSDSEFEVTGVEEGTGTYAGCAIFTCKVEAGHTFKVSAPGPIAEKKWYFQNAQQCVGKMLRVKYQEFTHTEQPVPFHPVALNFPNWDIVITAAP